MPRRSCSRRCRTTTVVWLAAMLASAASLAACGRSTPAAQVAPHQAPGTVPRAPIFHGTSGIIDLGRDAAVAVMPYPGSITQGPGGNARPIWLAYLVTTTEARASHPGTAAGSGGPTALDITPAGITTRGGLVVAAATSSASVLWAGVASYRLQLDGIVATSSDAGRRWSFSALPGSYDARPFSLSALSATTAAAVIGTGTASSVVVTDDAGSRWTTAVAAGRARLVDETCEVRSVAMLSSTSLLAGASCHRRGSSSASASALTALLLEARRDGPGGRWRISPIRTDLATLQMAPAGVTTTTEPLGDDLVAVSTGPFASSGDSGSSGGAGSTVVARLEASSETGSGATSSASAGIAPSVAGRLVRVTTPLSLRGAAASASAGGQPPMLLSVLAVAAGSKGATPANGASSPPGTWVTASVGGVLYVAEIAGVSAADGSRGAVESSGPSSWRQVAAPSFDGIVPSSLAAGMTATTAVATGSRGRTPVLVLGRADLSAPLVAGAIGPWHEVRLRLPLLSSGLEFAGS
jgi:hypothetical protein